MKSILEQLYDGEIHPAAYFFPKSEDYHALVHEHGRQYQELIEKLKDSAPSLIKPFTEFADKYSELLSPYMSAMFLPSFCLGAKMMIEIYEKSSLMELSTET